MPRLQSERLGRAAETCCEVLLYVIQMRAVRLEEGGPGSLAAPSFLPSFPPNLLFSTGLTLQAQLPPTSLVSLLPTQTSAQGLHQWPGFD